MAGVGQSLAACPLVVSELAVGLPALAVVERKVSIVVELSPKCGKGALHSAVRTRAADALAYSTVHELASVFCGCAKSKTTFSNARLRFQPSKEGSFSAAHWS